MAMQLPKGAKALITAILALVIAFLKHRSKKVKPTPALTNSPVSHAPNVSIAPEPVAQKEQPRKGEQKKEEQPCKEVAKEEQKKEEEEEEEPFKEVAKEEHKKEEEPCKEVAKEEQTKEEEPGKGTPKEELKKEQPCKEIDANEEQKREVVALQVPDDKDLVHAEVNIGEKILYTDGQEGVIHEFDNDGDIIVRRLSDGKSATWFADKCAKAEINIGDSVRHSCGERARVDSFDPDGDVIVLKPNGAKTTWYKNKTAGVPIKMSNSRKSTLDTISMAGVEVVLEPDFVVNNEAIPLEFDESQRHVVFQCMSFFSE
eukprot:CAMPEP_0169112732 /NCGR_PEP_ID=MMETSP1015-20121227/27799_1 /TAXON_ID=342587 /ORGANISM="Karlodinium micrum, Strain CCMP2283" /LENGTH=314 /DNA_ID=CAMNT_0009174803 /DNA_START=62 /DNA_END=1007 /DNA_ORIENTATION=-